MVADGVAALGVAALIAALIMLIATIKLDNTHDHFRGKDLSETPAEKRRRLGIPEPVIDPRDSIRYTLVNNKLCPAFSESLVARNAAIVCTKDDPLNIPGGVFRVLSPYSIARYPNPDIATSWDKNWGNPVSVPCTGATAAPNLQMR